ncbi:hypothetical protein DRN73_03395 [Candidatus Pacearchaeota archaeon]|nr:MAG: hypothetical protein DRN73_03395 [Candidatus Pacearchaeota archaeon]
MRIKNFFKKNYSKSWDFLKDSKNYLYFIVIVFFIFLLIGFFLPAPQSISERIMQFIQNILEKTKGMNFFQLGKFIFLNNLEVGFFGIILGIFLGVFPFLICMTNAYLLGFVASLSVQSDGILSLWRIFPHGIFEIPAIFISLALGMRLGLYTFFADKKTSFKKDFFNSLRVFFFIIMPLLIIAAIIEAGFIFFLRN